jgi:serine/threonine protein kinase
MLETFNAACCPFDQPTENFLQKVERIKLLRHSCIVPILDIGIEQGQPYVVREYLTKDSLRHRLDYLSPQRMSLQEALKIIFQVGQVLCYAHEHHVLHGSLKPETIFLDSNGEILLSDFGLASFIDMTKLFEKSDLQMQSYLAPEQFEGSLTEKSDQYALACLAYELITGHIPFLAQSLSSIEANESRDIDQNMQASAASFCENSQCPDYGKVERDNIRKFGKTRRGTQRWQCKTCQTTWTFLPMRHPKLLASLSDPVPDLPRPIEEAVLKAMAKDPSQRYADVSQFLSALQTASALPQPIVSRSQMPPAFGTFITTPTNPLEKIESEVPLATQLGEAAAITDFLERSEHGYNERNDSKTLMKPTRDPSVETLPIGNFSQPHKPLTPTLWVAFALSGIVLLLGTIILYALVPLRSPASPHPRKSNSTVQPQPSALVTNTPAIQSMFQRPIPSVGQPPNPPVSLGKKLTRLSWTASASIPNDLPSNALDGNAATRWSSGQAQTAGNWFLVNMGSVHSFSSITLDAGSSTGDYPQGYEVFVSADGSIWGNTIASGTGSGQLVTISFATQSARFIKVVLTVNFNKWWSIQEFNVTSESVVLNRSGWTASASSSNMVPSNALDGDPVTRWSSGQAQTASNWFLVDMGSVQHFSGITLDNGHDYSNDYPQGYQVFVSADGSNWSNAVASGNGSGSLVTISLVTQSARFIKIVLTVNGGEWWSIGELNVYS